MWNEDISAGTAVEAETEGAQPSKHKSYNFLPNDYLQTVHELRSSLSWTVHTLLSESRVMFIRLSKLDRVP